MECIPILPGLPELSLEQKLANVMTARERWLEVDPSLVIRNLDRWACGTQACFGGHLATWGEFRAMGVRTKTEEPASNERSSAPCIAKPGAYHENHVLRPYEVSGYLFGDEDLFDQRGSHYSDGDHEDLGLSDHDIVLARLDYVANNLRKQIAEKKA